MDHSQPPLPRATEIFEPQKKKADLDAAKRAMVQRAMLPQQRRFSSS